MCRRTTCKQCGKPSWAGCGAHVEQVLGDVPKSERCRCRERGAARPAARPSSTRAAAQPAAAPDGALGRFKAWLQR
jgi:hypothetical protein